MTSLSRLMAALTVTVAGLVSGGAARADLPAAAAAYLQQPVAWGPCWFSPLVLPVVAECTTLTVPRDWADPRAGSDLKVAISRVRASDSARRKGVLVTNPGGPGGSGLVLSYFFAVLQPKLAAQYDIIGMDPRGVGIGDPGDSTALQCEVEVAPLLQWDRFDSRDLSDAAVSARQAGLKAVADGCAKNTLTQYINTWQTTHDMDLIRAVLGEAKLNYLGFSYGTWLGAKYAALFPSNTGKMVLDSNVAWVDPLATAWQLMPLSFQRRWQQQFVPWVTRSTVFSKYVGAAPAQVNSTYELTRAAYIRYTGAPGAGDAVDSNWRSALYSDSSFLYLAFELGLLKTCLVDKADWSAAAFQACSDDYFARVSGELAAQGNQPAVAELVASRNPATGLLAVPARTAYDPVASIVAAAKTAAGRTVTVDGTYFAVRCGDGGQWHSPNYWTSAAAFYGPNYPLVGYAIPQEVCSYWTLPSQALPNPDARRLGPIVTVQSEFDPATAYENSMRNAAQFAGTRLISVEDAGGHGQYALTGNACVDDAVNAYLLDGVVPAARTLCGATPIYLEDVVYPAVGPLDSKTPPRSVRANVVDPQVRKLLQDAIAGTRPAKGKKK